ncbi:MAG: hypothetical protein V1929_07620 [bacterium]
MNDAVQRSGKKTIGLSLLITAAVWLVFSWPLPLHVLSAIPAGSAKPPQSMAVQPMMPGDHLQLDYHFWLFTDMLSGHTPWFHNLYEFNTGDDRARYEPGAYYLPFSLFYAVGSWIAGRAFGWNVAGFLSLWLTVFFTQRLARRYTDKEAATWIAAALSIALPYRWLTLMGGSPTGFSMMWVPALLLGLDTAVREDRFRGGWLAGIALLFAAWGDAHTFFFAALMAPCWCLFALLQRSDFAWRSGRSYVRLAVALAPVAVFALVALLSSRTTTRQIGEAKTHGRTIHEVALFSPHPKGLFAWADLGISNHIFIGYALTALVAAALLALIVRAAPDRRARLVSSILLVLGIAGMILLALGPFSPFSGWFFTAARKFIPHYVMIRQPAKIYCLMPSMIAVLFVLLAGGVRAPVLYLAGLLVLAEFRMQNQPIVCRLDREQGAYGAVAEAAAVEGSVPRALVIPLWPGDSHYTSICQHDASLYRIRLVNGYRPFVAQEYIDTVFHTFESANLGYLTDEQLDDLLGRGIHFVLLHEDLFPEKVSAFPVGFTLQQLLHNPRLRLLRRDGPVWAFEIESAPHAEHDIAVAWPFCFPARRLELEKAHLDGAQRAVDKDASRGGYVELHRPGACVATAEIKVVPAPDLRWLARLRGQGTVRCTTRAGAVTQNHDVNVQSQDWAWYDLASPALQGYESVSVSFDYAGGPVDVDAVMLVAGTWHPLQPGEAFAIPSPCFFHAGHTDIAGSSVVLSKGNVRLGTVLYGPKLPLVPGEYEIDMVIRSGGGAGMDLGTLILTYADGPEIRQSPVKAAVSTRIRFAIDKTLPFMAVFSYNGAADMELGDITIRRVR